ncbi:Putative PKHD-type hydroxylase [Glycine soja]|uniref:Putative PKHD-type hydroxylase n=1 Tax=Glycine soja TaxID=3848 RepID=A0A0B2RUC0_GLYSO|nr:Putative PKHD-type hydroxylase [Glycine soja]
MQVGGSNRLYINPQKDHKSKSYEDLQLEFNPLVFSSLEQYLPHHMLSLSREVKVHYMWSILLHYLPETERIRVREIVCDVAFLHNELFFVAAQKNTSKI